jgi:uncharacterized 2Fe-2S/4Fe-4S cluster protein (DUF4445 family)
VPKVFFYPQNKEIEVASGENLLRAAMLAEVHINAPCGGDGTCGKCRVVIEKGTASKGLSAKLTTDEIAQGYCLACKTLIESDLVVRIPVESQLGDRRVLERELKASEKTFLASKDLKELVSSWRHEPPVKSYHFSLERPSLEDNVSDLDRLQRGLSKETGLENISADISLLRGLNEALRKGDWQVTVKVEHDEGRARLVSVTPALQKVANYGLAIDIGTTTISLELVDLDSGQVLAAASDYNAQISYGEDIISRIVYSLKSANLKRLQTLVIKTINKLIKEVLTKVEARAEDISYVVAAGNTTMAHLFLGVSPRYIREDPYIPAFSSITVEAGEVGLNLPEQVSVFLVPGRASYVGGDITAGVLGSGMFSSDKLTLYIDIGTNGEIVLGNADWLLACSCSAGSAFEGGSIKHGTRATRGAIEQVRIDPLTFEPMILTIGGTKPSGICGSGLIDTFAELFLSGLIDERGKFNLSSGTKRLRTVDSTAEYILVRATDADIARDIVITEGDLDNLMRAKAAIFAGINILLESVEMPIEAIERILIAGSFGRHIELDKAITIGLLPEIPSEKVEFVGNGSLLGSRLMLLSKEMKRKAKEVAKKMTYLELSTNSKFMDKYISALFLPHTNTNLFPGVMTQLRAHRSIVTKKVANNG